jgi:hypothetical protein
VDVFCWVAWFCVVGEWEGLFVWWRMRKDRGKDGEDGEGRWKGGGREGEG